MKKRITSVLMALALCLTLLPTAALADDGDHTAGNHTGFTKLWMDTTNNNKLMIGEGESAKEWKTITDGHEDKYLPLEAGNYYLGSDLTLKDNYIGIVEPGVTLCLNGRTISYGDNTDLDCVIMVNYYWKSNAIQSVGSLTLRDCGGSATDGEKTDGTISGGKKAVLVGGGSTLDMYGGTITSSSGYGVNVNGSGNDNKKTTFNMYGGTITGSSGRGVLLDGGTTAKFTMSGGTISSNGNSGVCVQGGTFTMSGGEITGNTANREGGGVYVSGGTFTMSGGAKITGNSGTSGGGVFVNSGTFDMNGNASVSDNTASGNTADQGNGGGVYVGGGTFTMNDTASVSGNTATNSKSENTTYGGGVYVKSTNSTFTMNDQASITGNTAKNGGGVYASAGGKFNMNGNASITGNTANGVCVSGNATFTVSGAPTVTGNTKDGDASNVYLTGSAHITIGNQGLNGNDGSIGVTKTTGVGSVIAKGANENSSGKFFVDDGTYVVKRDGDELVLAASSAVTHTHSWTYTANGATIKATCTNTTGGCDVNKDGGSVTIKASTTTYDSTEKPATVEKSGNWESAFSENISIAYEQKNGDTYTSMKGGVPKDVGKYKASITVGGQIAFVEYEITDSSAPAEKTDPTYTAPTAKSGLVYTGENQSLINPGSTNHGRMWYKLGTDNVYSTLVPMAKDAGSYTVYYKVEGDATHNDVAEKSIEVRIEKAQLSGTPTFTKVTEAGKTLKDVTLTKPESWPEGSFEWGDGVMETDKNTPIVQGQEYWWYFNAKNHSATGKIVPWAIPSSGGGSTGGTTGGGSSSGGSSSSGGGSSSSDRDDYDSNPIVKTETKNNPDGSTTKTETRKDGSVTQTTTAKDGSTGTVKTDKNGKTEMNAKLSDKAVEDAKKSGEAVKAPVEVEASRNSGTAPTVKVELPKGAGETKVEIPVSNVKPGTVAVLVHPDGTEEILKDSIPTEDGIRLTVDGSATVKIVDNSKDFIDTRNHWAREEIDFVSARELVNGMTATIYAPNASATRAQLWTILARQNDANLSGGNTWYEKAQLWSKDKGISDGTNPNGTINRAQMVTMLWRAMGQPAAASGASFADVPTDSYYAQAVAWAIENGITAGVGNGRFDPNSTCTRAQIAAFLARSMK